jgi:DNA invertase Pin-like site-specific DNA recombinase
MGRLIGYARVSTPEQSLDLQLDELKAAGCKKIFSDKISGVRAVRPGFDQRLKTIREGDTLIVWRIDRLGRSMPHLVSVLQSFERIRTQRAILNDTSRSANVADLRLGNASECKQPDCNALKGKTS